MVSLVGVSRELTLYAVLDHEPGTDEYVVRP